MKVRVNKQDFAAGVDPHWAGGTILFSHVLNTLSLMFPEGERFFIRSVKRFSGEIRDEKLREEVKVFIGQEVQHGMAHERFNRAVSTALGDTGWFLDVYTKPTFGFLEPLVEKTRWRSLYCFALSLTAAAENMTAGFAQMLFSGDTLERIRDEEVKQLFAWHAAEEIEHRALAFDLLEQVDGTYAMRIGGMFFAYAVILGYVSAGTAWFLLKDPAYRFSNLISDVTAIFTDKNALGRVFWEGMLDYMRPDFHPNDHPIPEPAAALLSV